MTSCQQRVHVHASANGGSRNDLAFSTCRWTAGCEMNLAVVFGACTQVQAVGPRHQGGGRVAHTPKTCPEVFGCSEFAASSCVTWTDTRTAQPSTPPPPQPQPQLVVVPLLAKGQAWVRDASGQRWSRVWVSRRRAGGPAIGT